MVLTGLVAHTAQYGPDFDPECLFSLLQALVHKIHNLIRGEVPSVWGEQEGGTSGHGSYGSHGTGAGWSSLAPDLCLSGRHVDIISSPYAVAYFLRAVWALLDSSVGVSDSPPYF